ncbi:cytochrome P450 9e2-like [Megalopta genalis]|uniref:cytochrome P450 9e2-like n=1 Tax=Megalopta genalis TaxID=115081 RepID=UPI003FD29DFF
MENLTLALLLGAIVPLVIYCVKSYTFWQRRKIPIPDGYWPFLGHMWPVYTVTKSMTDHFGDMYKKCNKYSMFGLYDGFTPALVVREPRLIKTVMQSSFANFQKNGMDISPKKDPLLAIHPFLTVGEVWQNGRKRLTNAFSNARLKKLYTAVTQVCKKQQTYLEKQLKSKDQYEVELKHFFGRFTAESVANAGLGIEGYSYEDNPPPNSFHSIGLMMFSPNLLSAFITNLAFLKSNITIFLGIPLLDKRMDAFFRRVVHENLDIRLKDPTPKHDFFQLMIEQEQAEGEMNEERITSQTLSLFFDGFETSRLTLAFLGHNLAKYPEIQEKLRNEIRTTIADNDGVLTFEALKELKYMDQVISESQRHYPVGVYLKKVCTNECELVGSDGLSVRMQPGMEVYIPMTPVHHDPEFWSNPEVFDPDRFSEERKQDIEKMTFLPFGEGPRMCVGMRMAMLVIKSCMATLLNNYKIEMSPKTPLPLKWSKYHFLSEPITGIWCKISKL